ncbi:hypothetical protein [Arthrobacter pityocampae]|uniref:hypothetical protein n=1 Tax=Arthrobacter pityocampae TaxID=547334 RepID=UPI003736962D
MSEHYTKVEIVRPKKDTPTQLGEIVANLLVLAFRVLIVWWFVAAWFPEYGLTYWQLILPVYAVRALITKEVVVGRLLTK